MEAILGGWEANCSGSRPLKPRFQIIWKYSIEDYHINDNVVVGYWIKPVNYTASLLINHEYMRYIPL